MTWKFLLLFLYMAECQDCDPSTLYPFSFLRRRRPEIWAAPKLTLPTLVRVCGSSGRLSLPYSPRDLTRAEARMPLPARLEQRSNLTAQR